MPDIHPFCGIMYNPEKIKDFAQVVSEPYDVISPAQQRAYYNSHPYNIIRLILGKNHPHDTDKNNWYTRASKYFADWLKKDILLRDAKENIYIYTQTFSHNSKKKTRTGFVILLKLEDFAQETVLPHEHTFSQPVDDRLRLLKAVQANLSPIFAMFIDSQGKVNKLLRQYRSRHRMSIAVKKDQVWHRIWRLSDRRTIATIRRYLQGRQIFLADGHHRYEAALNYKTQMQQRYGSSRKESPFNYVMTYLVSTADPGLTILPTHRVVKLKAGVKPTQILSKLRRRFTLTRFTTFQALFSYMQGASRSACVCGAYFGQSKFYGLRLKQPKTVCRLTGKDRKGLSRAKDLDVAILHSIIIEQILCLVGVEENIYYTRDVQEATALVGRGQYQISFFLRPLRISQVKQMAKARKKMPHKSTYFYPKLLTGLVMNKFESAEKSVICSL